MEQNKIIKDLRVLTEDFLPSRILHRDSHLSSMSSNLSPLISGGKARHSFLHGPPGTGKTSLSLFLAEELKKQAPVLFCYVNCWESATRYSILYSLLRSFGVFAQRKGMPTDELLETFQTKVKGKASLVVLDEVDRLEDDEVLYDLISAQVGLIMISNSESALFNVDSRIRSRLSSAETIQFNRYSQAEIEDIIADRREWGLVPRTLGNSQVRKIASICGGDARTALGILSLAAQKAEDKDLDKIPDAFIEESLKPALTDSRRRTLEGLNPHQQIILEILKDGEKPSGELFSLVQESAEKKDLDSIVDRTFRNHAERLVRHGLVCSKGEGRWRVYSLK